jgi:hypothetical protein
MNYRFVLGLGLAVSVSCFANTAAAAGNWQVRDCVAADQCRLQTPDPDANTRDAIGRWMRSNYPAAGKPYGEMISPGDSVWICELDVCIEYTVTSDRVNFVNGKAHNRENHGGGSTGSGGTGTGTGTGTGSGGSHYLIPHSACGTATGGGGSSTTCVTWYEYV